MCTDTKMIFLSSSIRKSIAPYIDPFDKAEEEQIEEKKEKLAAVRTF